MGRGCGLQGYPGVHPSGQPRGVLCPSSPNSRSWWEGAQALVFLA